MANICKITKYVHSPDRSIEWYEYMMAYVKASTCLAEELKRLEDEVSSRASEFLIPLLFNVRHCIELLLKLFSYGTPEHPRNTHDISSIFKNYKANFEKLDKPQIPMIAKYFHVSETVIENYLKGSTIRLEEITTKYYGFAFLVDGDFLIEDAKNEMFRYPVNFDTDFKLDIENLHSKICSDEILDDLKFLFNSALLFLYTFGVSTEGEPFTKTLRDWANQDNKKH